MVRRGFLGTMRLPWSGDVTQAINPWSWAIRQLGFINVYETETQDPEQELKIIEDVASYGKQLGRTVEALQVLVSHTDSSKYEKNDRQALESFSEMAREIARTKDGRSATTEQDLDRVLEGISDLKTQDVDRYEKMLRKLRKFTEDSKG